MGRRAKDGEPALLIRSVHAGRLAAGHPAADAWLGLRDAVIAWMNGIAERLFRPNPLLLGLPGPHAAANDAYKGSSFYSGYAQRWALDVADRIADVENQLHRRLGRWLTACDAPAPQRRVRKAKGRITTDASVRRYLNVPEAVQDTVAPADFARLKALAAEPRARTAVFRDLLALPAADDASREVRRAASLARHDLSEAQAAVLEEILRAAMARYSRPVFNRLGDRATDAFVLRVELDGRAYAAKGFRNRPEALMAALNAGLGEAWAGRERVFRTEVAVVHPENRQGDRRPPLAIPIEIARGVWDCAARTCLRGRPTQASGELPRPEIGNLCIEVGPAAVEVKANIGRPRATPDIEETNQRRRHRAPDAHFEALAAALNGRRTLLGRDIGLVNTASYAVVVRDRDIEPALLRRAALMGKDEAREYLTGHWHDAHPLPMPAPDGAVRPVRTRFCGRDFLACIARHCSRIDALRKEIDLGYDKLARLRVTLTAPLGLSGPAERIPDAYRAPPGGAPALVHPNPDVQTAVAKFFRLLSEILKLKELRRAAYRKIEAVKANWFGWLSTAELATALALDAAVVREDAGYAPVPQDDPRYRGRTFNRVLADGARGLYERLASAKLAWLGIPEVRVPSFYTSVADVARAVVDTTMRRGELFVDAAGRRWHADEHAALVIALWLLLRPGKSPAMRQDTIEVNAVEALVPA